MSVKDTYAGNGDFLRATDLAGKKIKLTIENAEITDPFGKGEMKISVSFAGKEKKLLLNKTNANAIAAAYGDEETAWGGKELTLYPATTEYKGATVPCIRVITESPEAEEGELDF